MRKLFISSLQIFIALILSATLPLQYVQALSVEQRTVYEKGVGYYDIDVCNLPEANTTSTPVSGNVADLAKEMLANSNISYWTNNGVNTRDVVVDLSEGKKAKTTAPDGQQAETDVNPNILKFILEAAQDGKIMVNALSDKDHSSGSNHYSGKAVDLDNNPGNTTIPVDKLNKIAKKYGGEKNSETTHHHYDFTQEPNSGGPGEPEDVSASANSGSNNIKSIFMVGDSITLGARDSYGLKDKLKDKGITSSTIIASGGGSLITPGTAGEIITGLDALTENKAKIAKVDAVVMAHITNHYPDNFEAPLKQAIKKIKEYNPDAKIFWVNTKTDDKNNEAYSKRGAEKKNNILEKQSKELGFSIIDISSVPLSSDDIHPDYSEKGFGKWGSLVASGVSKDSTNVPDNSQTSGTGNCACGGSAVAGSFSTVEGSADAEKNAKIIYDFFIDKGLKPFQVAAILGNIKVESNYNPKIVEGGASSDTPVAGKGFGLVQWTDSGRQSLVTKRAQEQRVKASNLGFQMEHIWWELNNNEKASFEALKKTTKVGAPNEANLDSAWYVFSKLYERPAVPENPERGKEANAKLAQFGSGGGSSSSSSDTTGCTRSGGDESGEVTGVFSLPVARKYYDQHKDWFTKPHHDYPASDIPVSEGTSVFSMTDGKVIAAPTSGDCGVGIIIDSADGVRYTYCHGTDGGSIPGAKQGDTVKAGQKIMTSGNTGQSSGPHLHLQIDVGGVKKCPQKLFVSIAEGNPISPKSLPDGGCTN